MFKKLFAWYLKHIDPYMARLLGLPPLPPPTPRFWYTWLAHPFDDPQYFHIDAADKATADRLAMERFTAMFDRKETIMTEFWPMKHPPPLKKSFRPY